MSPADSFLENPDGSRILYQVLGVPRGPFITLINGYTRAWTDFRSMAKRWNEAGFAVLAFDNRGAGQSTVTGPFTLGDMAGDVIRLWDHVGIPASTVLGISMGGVIAQRLTAEHAARVERLVLVSTCLDHAHMKSTVNQWASTVPDVIEQLRVYFAPEFFEKNRPLVEAMAKNICQNASNPRFNEQALLQRQALNGFDHTALMKSLKVPTAILHGELDRVIAAQAAEELHQAIAGSELLRFPGKGHLLLAEAPKELFEGALQFVAGRGRSD